MTNFLFRNGCKVSVTSNMEPDLTALMSEVHFLILSVV